MVGVAVMGTPYYLICMERSLRFTPLPAFCPYIRHMVVRYPDAEILHVISTIFGISKTPSVDVYHPSWSCGLISHWSGRTGNSPAGPPLSTGMSDQCVEKSSMLPPATSSPAFRMKASRLETCGISLAK